VDESQLVTVEVFRHRHEAEVARAMLASAGVVAMVVADDEGGLNPGFYAAYGVRLVVREVDLEDAEALLEKKGP
jgi:hypothetical protein